MLIESAFGVYTMGLRSTSVRGSLFRMLRESKRNGSKEARQGERVEIEVGFAEHTKECSRGKTHAWPVENGLMVNTPHSPYAEKR